MRALKCAKNASFPPLRRLGMNKGTDGGTTMLLALRTLYFEDLSVGMTEFFRRKRWQEGASH